MDPAQSAADLNTALAALETALLTPVVSGEMEAWARTAQQAATALDRRLPPYLRSVLHPQYAEIARSDAELLPRVEQLIAEDQNLLLEQSAFCDRINTFAQRAAEVKRDEAQVAAERDGLEQEGIGLIVRIKKQRAAADTWLAEANYRDRGPVD
jgi:hypothetical protein